MARACCSSSPVLSLLSFLLPRRRWHTRLFLANSQTGTSRRVEISHIPILSAVTGRTLICTLSLFRYFQVLSKYSLFLLSVLGIYFDSLCQSFKRAPDPLHENMQSPQLAHPPISCELRNILLLQEAASASLTEAQFLIDAATTTLDLIDAAEVRLHPHMPFTGLQGSFI